MTTREVSEKLQIYLNQIPILADNNADWALLHYIVIFPDICGALENIKGEASKTSYVDWANRYLADEFLTGEEWYEIRCTLLHQGTTIGKKRYPAYSYKSPVEKPNPIAHKFIDANGNIVLDVHAMKDELITGLQRWFMDIEQKRYPEFSVNVEKNLKNIAGVYPIEITYDTNVPYDSLNLSGADSTSYITPSQK